MKENINRLKLIGNNTEDLKTISAYCQDSIVKIRDFLYLKENKIFIMLLSRFMWEDLERGVFRKYKRIKSILKFNNVDVAKSKNINQLQKERNLELLAFKISKNRNNIYKISLIFSGDSVLLLNLEEIDVMLDDQDLFWEVKKFPKHKI